jgi:hypothetical protein
MHSERKTECVIEELPEDEKEDFFNPEYNNDEVYEDDEPYEKEYCD